LRRLLDEGAPKFICAKAAVAASIEFMLRLQVWELKTGDIVSTGRAHSSPVENLAWAPDEKQLVTYLAREKRMCAY
jgi:hypothetical protein